MLSWKRKPELLQTRVQASTHKNTRASVDLSSRFKLKSSQTVTVSVLYRQNNNKHRGRHPELLTLLAKSTGTYKGSVWWREKWRERKKKQITWWKGRQRGFCGGIPDAPDAPVLLQTMQVACLSACQPAILSASLAETERRWEEQRWARWCRGGTGEISGAHALPVKSDMTFWFCHLSPTAMSDSALRSVCHPPQLSSASVFLNASLSFFVSCSHSISFSCSPFLSRVAVSWRKSRGVTFRRSWGIIGWLSSFLSNFPNIYFSLPVLCVALNEGRCQGRVCLETQKSFLRCKIREKIE